MGKKPENWEEMNENERKAWQINNDPDFWDDGCYVEPGSPEEEKINNGLKAYDEAKLKNIVG